MQFHFLSGTAKDTPSLDPLACGSTGVSHGEQCDSALFGRVLRTTGENLKGGDFTRVVSLASILNQIFGIKSNHVFPLIGVIKPT